MKEKNRKQYGGLIGMGLMMCWLFSILFCYGIKFWPWRYLGFGVVTTTMISAFLYINSLEEELGRTSRRPDDGLYEGGNE